MARKYQPPSDAPPYRILLIEDHAIVREGLAAILAAYPAEFTVIGQAATSQAARDLATHTRPHLIITDFFLGDGGDGTRLLTDLTLLSPAARILVLSLSEETDLAERALRSGAHGYLAKHQGTERLLHAARALLQGGLYLTPELQARLFDRFEHNTLFPPTNGPDVSKLTEREHQIFQLLGTDLPLENIAQRLGISTRTIASHRENIRNKLNYQATSTLHDAARTWVKSLNSGCA